VGDLNGVGEGLKHFYRGLGSDDLEQSAFAQFFVTLQMLGKGTKSCRR